MTRFADFEPGQAPGDASVSAPASAPRASSAIPMPTFYRDASRDEGEDVDEAALAEAYARGRGDGAAEAEASAAAAPAAARGAVDEALVAIERAFAAREAALQAGCASVLKRIVEAVAPSLARRGAADEFAALIGAYAADAAAAPMRVRAHPDVVAMISPLLARDGDDCAARSIDLDEDASLEPGFIEATWADGGFSRDPAPFVDKALALIEKYEHPVSENAE